MIVVELQGGLGNQMFQYALGRHLSLINNTQLYLDTQYLNNKKPKQNFTFRNFDLDIFNIQAETAPRSISKKYGLDKSTFQKILNRIFKPGPLQVVVEKEFPFNPAILLLSDNKYLNGYWQSDKYFNSIQAIVRKDFILKLPLTDASEKLRVEIKNCNAVCVHVRRGDFVKNNVHGTLGMEYYGKAATLICKQVTSPVFYVFSDDINWCRENITLPHKIFYVGDEYTEEKSRGHFSLMTSCKHFIIPNSSFGWWAAWLNSNTEKIVIAPKIWFHSGDWDAKDILPSNWIAI